MRGNLARVLAFVLASILCGGEVWASTTYTVLMNTDDQRVVERTESGVPTQRLTVTRVSQTEDSITIEATFQSDATTVFLSTITYSPSGFSATGTVSGTTFSYSTVVLGANQFESTFTFGSATLGPIQYSDPPSLTQEQKDAMLAHFQVVNAQGAGQAILTLLNFLDGMPDPRYGDYLVSASITGIVGRGGTFRNASFPAASPIGEYVECLKDSCRDCGGCWKTLPIADCYNCGSTPFFLSLFLGGCYIASTVICFMRLINPINPITGAGGS